MRKRYTRWAVVCCVALLLGLASSAQADDPPSPPAPGAPPPPDAGFGTVRISGRLDFTPVGDAKGTVRVAFRPADFAKVKAHYDDPRKWLQDFTPSRADFEILPDATATYDDAASAVVLSLGERGSAKNRGEGHWTLEIEAGPDFAGISPGSTGPTAKFVEKGTWDGGVAFESVLVYGLPAGAKNAAFDGPTRVLSWDLPFSGGTGAARIPEPEIKVKDRLMASIYKVYGLGADFAPQWVAKSVWRNAGTNVARNLRVRYRLEGYSDWSGWDKFPEVVPGQTVVSLYYPVLQASIARLRTNTPADLRVEWRWEDAEGKVREDDASKRLTLLGVNEFVFSNLLRGESYGTWQEAFNNAPLLAAWVSRNDPVVKQFSAMANRLAGGLGATTDDASAVRVLQACYDLLRANDFTYQHPPALADQQVSFDPQAVQNVKFPRDVIRDRSGTCIDLAILFASMANAVGLDPYLALVPGHCFPFVKLPSGTLFAVEATGVGGGVRYGSLEFDRARQIGNQELAASDADGRVHVIKVRENWTRGISNPELEDFPPDILEKWGIKEEGRGTPAGPGGTAPPATPPAANLDGLLGIWGGDMSHTALAEGLTLDTMVVGVERNEAGVWRAGLRLELTGLKDGVEVKGVVTCIYENGRADGRVVRFAARKWERTAVATGAVTEVDGNPLVLEPSGDGRLKALLEGDDGFSATLAAKVEEPVPAGHDRLVGSWGGDMGGADVGAGVKLDEMRMDVTHGADGAWTAVVKMHLTVPAGGGMKVVIDVRHTGGRLDGDGIRFDKVPWHRTVLQTGQKDDIEGNPLRIAIAPDGRLRGVYEGADGMAVNLSRR